MTHQTLTGANKTVSDTQDAQAKAQADVNAQKPSLPVLMTNASTALDLATAQD